VSEQVKMHVTCSLQVSWQNPTAENKQTPRGGGVFSSDFNCYSFFPVCCTKVTH